MASLILPSALRQQPQQGAQLNRRSVFAAGAQAVLSAGQDINYASGKPLVRGGAGYLKQGFPAGQAWSFRKNFYLETESLPAIGTASFVEFWLGYPSTDTGVKGAAGEPQFVTGQSTNQMGIASVLGSGRGAGTPGQWGYVNTWGSLTASGDTVTAGQLTLLMVVRRQAGFEFWRNGRLVGFVAASPTNYPAGTLICGSFVEDTGYWPTSSDTLAAGRIFTPVEPTPAEIRAFHDNPWQTFQAPPRRLWAASTTGATDTQVAPSNGALVLTGYAPTVGQTATRLVTPGAGTLALTGYAPTVSQSSALQANPGPATLTLIGYAPTVAQSALRSVSPGAGALSFTGYAPTVSQRAGVTPNIYAFTIMDAAPLYRTADLGPDALNLIGSLL